MNKPVKPTKKINKDLTEQLNIREGLRAHRSKLMQKDEKDKEQAKKLFLIFIATYTIYLIAKQKGYTNILYSKVFENYYSKLIVQKANNGYDAVKNYFLNLSKLISLINILNYL